MRREDNKKILKLLKNSEFFPAEKLDLEFKLGAIKR